MAALKWPRPGGFHIRDAILARRHSRFSHFFGEISEGKLSILRFFLQKKCDGAKLAPSRGWRFRDAILTRRREQQIPPCLRSFLIFDKKKRFCWNLQKCYSYIIQPIRGGNKEGSPKRAKIAVPRVGFTFRMRFRRPP